MVFGLVIMAMAGTWTDFWVYVVGPLLGAAAFIAEVIKAGDHLPFCLRRLRL